MSPTRVAVIGAGVAGPALAIFLKSKGYEPVIFERSDSTSSAGIGLGIQRNGLLILNKIPGLLDHLEAFPIDEFNFYSAVEEDKGILGGTDHPRRMREQDGFGMCSIRRSILQQNLVEFAQIQGVELKWGYKLEGLEQHVDSVTVKFSNDHEESFSFVVGCDGLHSNTRSCLFGEQPAEYSGISQWGGISPTPQYYRGKALAADVYGNGMHMILVSLNYSTMHWAISQREPESKETWRAIDAAAAEKFKATTPVRNWDFGAGELVRTSTMITKYGLYGRPELKTWHQGRVLLIGDAAHPTSPHVGQGANQCFEDIDMFITLLEKYNPSAESPSTEILEAVYTELETVRVPRANEIVQLARKQGETRVVEGVEACIARNNYYRELSKNRERHKERFGA